MTAGDPCNVSTPHKTSSFFGSSFISIALGSVGQSLSADFLYRLQRTSPCNQNLQPRTNDLKVFHFTSAAFLHLADLTLLHFEFVGSHAASFCCASWARSPIPDWSPLSCRHRSAPAALSFSRPYQSGRSSATEAPKPKLPALDSGSHQRSGGCSRLCGQEVISRFLVRLWSVMLAHFCRSEIGQLEMSLCLLFTVLGLECTHHLQFYSIALFQTLPFDGSNGLIQDQRTYLGRLFLCFCQAEVDRIILLESSITPRCWHHCLRHSLLNHIEDGTFHI